MQPSFLEAHYYAGGLRHRAYPLQGDRPVWAPAPDIVGFSDEFLIGPNVAALEIRRLEYERRRLTWLAVYHPSVDARLGDRRNHAGVGIWLDELTIADARSLVHGLDVLAKKLAESVNPDTLDAPAREFLKEYVPQYLLPLREMPEFPGLQFSSGRLASTCLTYIQTNQPLGESAQVSDHVLGALFSSRNSRDASRELICISASPLPTEHVDRFHIVTSADDALSKVVREIPGATKALTAKLDAALVQLEAMTQERDAATARVTEFDDLQNRVRGFESDPLNTVLNAVREVSCKIDTVMARIEQPRQVVPGRMPTTGSRIVSRPPSATEPEPTEQLNCFIVVVLGVAFVLAAVGLFALADKYLRPILWPAS